MHGDYRLDNMLFGERATRRGRSRSVDWQTVGWGQVMTDASYFLGGSLTLEDRRAHEQELLREYHEALHEHGVRGFGWEECWEGYRRQAFLGVLMTVAPAMLVQRTERGDEMFLRDARALRPAGARPRRASSCCPSRAAGARRRCARSPRTRRRHAPGSEELWNESWYFDAVSADERLGVYTRLGLYPNLGVSWMTAFVCGPDRPTRGADRLRRAAARRARQLSLGAERLRAEHICERAAGELRGAPAGRAREALPGRLPALLRGEPGEPVELALDAALGHARGALRLPGHDAL